MRVRTTSSASFSPCVESREMVRVSDFLYIYLYFFGFFSFSRAFCQGTICDWVWWGDRKWWGVERIRLYHVEGGASRVWTRYISRFHGSPSRPKKFNMLGTKVVNNMVFFFTSYKKYNINLNGKFINNFL
jgi:hypothetical protein